MDFDTLLQSTEVSKQNGISVQDTNISKWLHFGSIMSTDEERTIQNGYFTVNGKQIDVILKSSEQLQCLLYEYVVGREVNKLLPGSPNFVTTYGLFHLLDPLNNKTMAYLVIEKVNGVTLNEFIETAGSPDTYLNIMLQTFTALKFAQEQIQFTHYDLHFENILVQDAIPTNLTFNKDYMIRIIDYGYSHATIPYNAIYACIKSIEIVNEGENPSVMDPLYDVATVFNQLYHNYIEGTNLWTRTIQWFNQYVLIDNNFGDIVESADIDVPNYHLLRIYNASKIMVISDIRPLTKQEANIIIYERVIHLNNKLAQFSNKIYSELGDQFIHMGFIRPYGYVPTDEELKFIESIIQDNDYIIAYTTAGHKLYTMNQRHGATIDQIIQFISSVVS